MSDYEDDYEDDYNSDDGSAATWSADGGSRRSSACSLPHLPAPAPAAPNGTPTLPTPSAAPYNPLLTGAATCRPTTPAHPPVILSSPTTPASTCPPPPPHSYPQPPPSRASNTRPLPGSSPHPQSSPSHPPHSSLPQFPRSPSNSTPLAPSPHAHRPSTTPQFRAWHPAPSKAAPPAPNPRRKPPIPLDNANPRHLAQSHPECWVSAPGVGQVYSWARHHHANMVRSSLEVAALRNQRVLQATYQQMEVQRLNADVFDGWTTHKTESTRRSKAELTLTLPWSGYMSHVSTARGFTR